MTRSGVVIGGAIVLLLAGLVGWWFYTFEPVSNEIDLPARGEAAWNPLFGLKKTLQARGHTVVSHGSLSLRSIALQPSDTLVLDADVRVLDAAQVDTLMDWLESGGHLVFALPHATSGRGGALLDALDLRVVAHFSCLALHTGAVPADGNAATPTGDAKFLATPPPGALEDDEDDEDDPPGQRREPAADSAGAAEVRLHRGDNNWFCSSVRFRIDADDEADFAWLWGSAKNGYLFGRHDLGKGSWMVAANLGFLSNSHLQRDGNPALAWQVLAPALGSGTVHLVYGTDVPPWYVLIVRYGWPVLLSLLLALLAWLWARSQRFGPLLPLALPPRRALLEHVHASGDFVFARGRSPVLYQAARRAFMERLQRRDPGLAALQGDALQAALVAQYHFDPVLLQQALAPGDIHRPAVFFASIKTLLSMRAQL